MKFVQLLPVAFCHWSKRAMRATAAAKGEERGVRERGRGQVGAFHLDMAKMSNCAPC